MSYVNIYLTILYKMLASWIPQWIRKIITQWRNFKSIPFNTKEEGRAVYYHGYPVELYQRYCTMLLENEKKSALEIKG